MSLENEIKEFLKSRGAIKVRFTNVDGLVGGPPSSDLTYKFPEARSAISFAFALDRDKIRAFLGKKDQAGHGQDQIDKTLLSSGVSGETAVWLTDKGFYSERVHGNNHYRKEVTGWQLSMPPDISHRYVAARSGLGSFGWSGNVGIPGYGTAVILGTVVTAAELAPTPPLGEDESFCDKCKLCAASCPAGMFSKDEETSVSLGEMVFTFAKRIDITRCHIVCGGFAGLHKSGKWSSWSPGRYELSEDQKELFETMIRAIGHFKKRPHLDEPGGYPDPKLGGIKIQLTCGNCNILCWGDKEDTRENYRLLTSSGCVVQKEDGKKIALPPDQARDEFEKMSAEHKKLYY